MSDVLSILVAVADTYFLIDSVIEKLQDGGEARADLKIIRDIYTNAREQNRLPTTEEYAVMDALSEKYRVRRQQAIADAVK